LPDIDLDFPASFSCNDIFPTAVPASKVNNKGELTKHGPGYYFQNMARDKVTNLAAIPFEEAELLGYFKIDFLHISPLDLINNKQELRELINKEPDWNILRTEEQVQKLFHISKHYELLQKLTPRSVNDLADVLALVRPGKKHLLDDYTLDKIRTRKVLYQKTEGYYLKKSHAVAYALTIVMQMHLISLGRL
jgi:DNA polymerase III alpha subunit